MKLISLSLKKNLKIDTDTMIHLLMRTKKYFRIVRRLDRDKQVIVQTYSGWGKHVQTIQFDDLEKAVFNEKLPCGGET